MEKAWYQSKSVWAAVFMGVAGVVEALGYPVPDLAYQLAGALGIYGIRSAQG